MPVSGELKAPDSSKVFEATPTSRARGLKPQECWELDQCHTSGKELCVAVMYWREETRGSNNTALSLSVYGICLSVNSQKLSIYFVTEMTNILSILILEQYIGTNFCRWLEILEENLCIERVKQVQQSEDNLGYQRW